MPRGVRCSIVPIHQSDPERKPDSEYVPGELAYLLLGNRCRLLDGRRTSGVIESVDERSGFFRWRITAFEDEGRAWEMPLEVVTRYQFERGSKRRSAEQVAMLQATAKRLSQPLVIEAEPAARARTEAEISETEGLANRWLDQESSFFAHHNSFQLGSRLGPADLGADLQRYMQHQSEEFKEIEARTVQGVVLNPDSGEWIKGMLIAMAEAGLVDYSGTIVRTPSLFEGIGSKELRRAHCVHRLAFVRAAFRRAGYSEVTVYRGMSSESNWLTRDRSFVSCTFSLRVARSFASFDQTGRFKTSYLMKLTIPIEQLWMTHCETAAMNGRYAEAEALVLNAKSAWFCGV